MSKISARLATEPFDPAAELAELTRRAAGDGAIVSFVGLARDVGKAGETVAALVLEHHPQLTARSLEDIASDALRRFDVSQVHVVHRCGEMLPGEPIVFAGASSPHRRAAFEATDYLMDRVKTEAIFWKREESPEGSSWIEPTDADHADRSRWE